MVVGLEPTCTEIRICQTVEKYHLFPSGAFVGGRVGFLDRKR